ncbi:MAG: hypothetical protein IPK64_09305 [bacterium]|nr:hypothetical protein [bacterium]
MPGDGVSLPTTLAQLGSVAKAQVRVTSPSQPATPFAELQEQKGELKARKVQETEPAQADRRIDGDRDAPDKRQRRRQRRQARTGPVDPDPSAAAAEENASPLGTLVDLRA